MASNLFGPTNILNGLLGRLSERWALVDTKSGNDLVRFTSFLSCDVRNESTVVSSQVEEGSFASYNKVDSPLEVNVRLGIQGNDGELKDALDTLDSLRKSTKLVNLVMPSAEYRDLNLEMFNYTIKTELGRGVLFVDLSLKEIRQVKAEYSNEKIPEKKTAGKTQGVDKGKAQDAAASGNQSGGDTSGKPVSTLKRIKGS